MFGLEKFLKVLDYFYSTLEKKAIELQKDLSHIISDKLEEANKMGQVELKEGIKDVLNLNNTLQQQALDLTKAIKGDPTAALCLAPVSGVGCSNERKGEFKTDFKGGFHGYVYLPDTKAYDPTSLIIHGNIDRSTIERFFSTPDTIQQTSIAPMILRIMEMENPQSK